MRPGPAAASHHRRAQAAGPAGAGPEAEGVTGAVRSLMICTEKLPVPPVRGGAIQTYIHAVAPRLGRHHRVTVLGVADPELPDREIRDGVEYSARARRHLPPVPGPGGEPPAPGRPQV